VDGLSVDPLRKKHGFECDGIPIETDGFGCSPLKIELGYLKMNGISPK